jgi:hypothetical protein
MVTSIISGAQVICCTCIGAGDSLLKDQYFPVVVIDEATQAIEPATLVPLCKVGSFLLSILTVNRVRSTLCFLEITFSSPRQYVVEKQ